MTYEQAKNLKLIDRKDMLSPCGECIYDGPITVSEQGTKYKKGCQHPKVIGSANEAWICWHPVQKDCRGFTLVPRDSEWLIYFEPVENFRKKYEKVIKPDFDVWTKFKNYCSNADLFEDKELQMQWHCKLNNGWCYYSVYCKCKKKNIVKQGKKLGKLLETSPVWVQPSLF